MKYHKSPIPFFVIVVVLLVLVPLKDYKENRDLSIKIEVVDQRKLNKNTKAYIRDLAVLYSEQAELRQ